MINLSFTPKSVSTFSVIFLFCLLVSSCAKESSQSLPSSPYTQYTNKGISVSYPAHWVFQYDKTPGLYSDREILVNISELGTFTIHLHLTDNPHLLDVLNLHDYTERAIHGLGLIDSPLIIKLEQKPIKINNYKGYRVSWTDTFMGEDNYELTILEYTTNKNKVFVVFNAGNSSIAEVNENIENIVSRLSINS